MTSVGEVAATRGRTVEEVLAACRAADVIAWSAHAPLDDRELAAVDAVLSAPPPPPPTAAGFAPIGGAVPPPPPTGAPLPPPPGYGPGLPPPPPPAAAKRTWLRIALPGLGAAILIGARIFVGVIGTDIQQDRAEDQAELLAWADLVVGDCFDDHGSTADPTAAARIGEVDCADAHDAEVYAVGDADLPPGADYPGPLEMSMQAVRVCGPGFEPFVGTPYERSALDVYTMAPLEATWNGLDERTIVCAVVNRDGTQLPAGTAAGSGR